VAPARLREASDWVGFLLIAVIAVFYIAVSFVALWALVPAVLLTLLGVAYWLGDERRGSRSSPSD
jgi:uncharacterized membrane protein